MSSATDPTAAFYAHIRASGLLPEAQLQELWVWIGTAKPDVQGLAREVNRRGWLTAFQIKEIFKGRGRDLTIGKDGKYILLDLLGEGGMGRVYKAHQTRLGRDVAVKVIRKEKLKHPAAEARFKQEINALSTMKHPNVVDVIDADLDGDTKYYVMEYVDGTDLTRMVRERGPLPVHEACEYIRQAALGLHHAFEKELVHRDIKPSNILVSRNGKSVKLVDLGLARLGDEPAEMEAGRITQEGFVIGTPDFLAPEQARNPMNVDIRADIYALGGTLYYLLTGKVPYDGANPTEKLLKHCTEPPPRLLFQRMDAPPQLEQIIHWCMAKPPEARPQTPLQLALALQPFSTTAPAAPVAAPPAYPYPAAPPGYPLGFPTPPETDPNRSSQVFKLPPQTTSDDPIRRRGEGGFPWSMVLIGLGSLLVIAILGYGVYIGFIRPGEAPIESFTNSQSIRMVKLDGGKFRMGSPEAEPGRKSDEGPQHEVAIRGPFFISATEVSHGQFLQVMERSPTKSATIANITHSRPVESVTWVEANEFCRRLTEKEKGQPWARKGWAYRLPTEAEWEYAARAGTETPFAFGNQIAFEKHALFATSENDVLGIGAVKDPVVPLEVGKTEANKYGLHDMHGNVAEWCLDWYKPGYPGDGPRDNPTGPNDGDKRVIRGGSFKTSAAETRSAARAGAPPAARRDDVGFRIVYAPVMK
jgi:formylglycine-generating enzyme required for sulfatase activity/tRNA A-37 threonylcarbamoyl transferase component Bud32